MLYGQQRKSWKTGRVEKSLKTNSNNLNTLHISIHNEQTHENSKILFRKDVQARLEQEKAGKSFKKKEVNWFLMKGNFSLTINYLFLKMRPGGFEPPTSTLGRWHSIQAELRTHICGR